jgi:peptidoglycan hydrolase-like amidase
MPTPTYDLLASTVVSSSTNAVTFLSVPSTYRDLVVVVTATTSVNAQLRIRPNELTTSMVSVTAEGNGTTATTNNYSNIGEMGTFNNMSSDGSVQIIQFMDYAQTNKHKMVIMRTNRASAGTSIIIGRWASTDAINAVQLVTDGGTFNTGSTFYLYGIVA